MSPPINGKEILEALTGLREPATFSEILKYVAKGKPGGVENVKKSVKSALAAGVRYGFLESCQDYYYTISDAVDALEDDCSDPEDAMANERSASVPINQRNGKVDLSRAAGPAAKAKAKPKPKPKPKNVVASRSRKPTKTQDEEDDDDDEEYEDEDDDDSEEDDSEDEVKSVTGKSQQTKSACPYDCYLCRKRNAEASRSRSSQRPAKRRR